MAFAGLQQAGEHNLYTSYSRNQWEVINPIPINLTWQIVVTNLVFAASSVLGLNKTRPESASFPLTSCIPALTARHWGILCLSCFIKFVIKLRVLKFVSVLFQHQSELSSLILCPLRSEEIYRLSLPVWPRRNFTGESVAAYFHGRPSVLKSERGHS